MGIVAAESTVRKYMLPRRRPPSPTWRAFTVAWRSDGVSARDRREQSCLAEGLQIVVSELRVGNGLE
jgi:hypothetical protein